MAINKVYEVGPDRFGGPIRVEKTEGNETSVILLDNPDVNDHVVIMNKEEFQGVVQAVNELMGWSND